MSSRLGIAGIVLLAAFGLAACGGGGGGTAEAPPPPPTPYESALAAIAAASTTEAAQAAYDAVKDDVTATEGDALQAAVDARAAALQMAARAAQQRMALSTAAAGIDISDLITQENVDAANAAIAELQRALTGAEDLSDADKAMYRSQLDAATAAVNAAQDAIDTDILITAQRKAISDALDAADAAIAAVNDEATDEQVQDADDAVAAVKAALAAAVDIPEGDSGVARSEGTIGAMETALNRAKTSRLAAIDDARMEADREMAAAGKALKGALTATPLDYAVTVTSLTAQGVVATMNHDQDGGTTALVTSPRLAPGDSAGSLGDWAGTHYSHKNAGTGVSNEAIIYTNQAAAKSYPIASRYAVTTNVPSGAGTYTAAIRTLSIADATADANIKADDFPTAGTTTFTPTSPSNENIVRGTYQGAAGNYRCTGTCTATANANGVISLSDAWVFVHDMGAMVSVADINYLTFGWWLQKDKDDDPTLASAFTFERGDVEDGETLANPNTLSGKATYTGAAAGKYAISDPLRGGEAGHFTADATLNATFGNGATNGLTGTIDNFMANDEAVDWSVTLHRRSWDGANSGATVAADNASTATVDESMTQTVWSIDGNAAAASGTWSAQMYDELPGAMPNGDGSNVPTSVTGTFESHFGSTHTMVGAFGASKE